MSRFHTALFLLALLAAPSAFAQDPSLTLEDCIRLAQSAQSNVTIARQQAEIARLGVTQARAALLPQAGVNTGFTYNSPLPRNRQEFSYVALNGVREYVGLGAVNLDVDTSGRLRAQLSRARADVDITNFQIQLSQRDLKRAISAAYYRLLLARHLVTAARDSLRESEQFQQRTSRLVEGMEVARADLVKAESSTQFLQQQLAAAELEAKLANHDLASFWTMDVTPELKIVDELEAAAPAPVTRPANQPFLARLEFRVFDAQRRGFLADARRARADLYPQLSLALQYGIDANRVAWSERGYAAFVNLRVPVFDWFRARSAQRQFQLQAKQIETQAAVARRNFSRDYEDALTRVEMIYNQLAITEAQVKSSEENLRLARIRYEGGEGSALDVVSAQSQLVQARSNLYTARANYLNARADLEVTAAR